MYEVRSRVSNWPSPETLNSLPFLSSELMRSTNSTKYDSAVDLGKSSCLLSSSTKRALGSLASLVLPQVRYDPQVSLGSCPCVFRCKIIPVY
jgi:hypothetical protein